MSTLTPVVPTEMTWRARFYLCVGGTRHIGTGAVAIAMYDRFPDVDLFFPIWAWGIVFVLGGGHLLYAAYAESETNARIALAVSAIVTAVWGAGFWALAVEGAVTPLVGILMTGLTLKDLTIVGEPMRTPFESIMREYGERDEE